MKAVKLDIVRTDKSSEKKIANRTCKIWGRFLLKMEETGKCFKVSNKDLIDREIADICHRERIINSIGSREGEQVGKV